jgi:hypothetical protein
MADATHRLLIKPELERISGLDAQRRQLKAFERDVDRLLGKIGGIGDGFGGRGGRGGGLGGGSRTFPVSPPAGGLRGRISGDISKGGLQKLGSITGLSAESLTGLAGAVGLTSSQLGALTAAAGRLA